MPNSDRINYFEESLSLKKLNKLVLNNQLNIALLIFYLYRNEYKMFYKNYLFFVYFNISTWLFIIGEWIKFNIYNKILILFWEKHILIYVKF